MLVDHAAELAAAGLPKRCVRATRSRSLSVVFLVLAITVLHLSVPGAPGDLDSTFGNGGKVTATIRACESTNRIWDVAVQSDGKIVVAGNANGSGNFDFAVLRYNPDGSLDSTFDCDGKVTTAIGSILAFGEAVVIQEDGKILVAGHFSKGSDYDFALVRYNPDGSRDTTFDADGIVSTAIGAYSDYGYDVVLQPDGKILVAGAAWNGSNYDFAVARYNPDGSLDSTFDKDGKLTTPIGDGDDRVKTLLLQLDGKIIAAGTAGIDGDDDFALVRYNSDGSLDTSFDGDGKVTTAIGSGSDSPYHAAIQKDGKMLVAGSAYIAGSVDFVLARYNTDGSLDSSFAGDGTLTVPVGAGSDSGRSVALQDDGKIIMGGFAILGADADFAVIRCMSDGSLDTGFGTNGKIITPIGTGDDYAQCMAIQSDGRIVLAGHAHTNTGWICALARYRATGIPDTGFDGDGVVMTEIVPKLASHAQGVVIQDDGKIVAAGYVWIGNNRDFAAARLDSNGGLDLSFSGDGTTSTAIGIQDDMCRAVALQSDGRIVTAGETLTGSIQDFGLVRFNTNGTPDATFDGDGKVVTSLMMGADVPFAVALQSDGKIVAAGTARVGSAGVVALARYNRNGSLDETFDGDGMLTTPIGAGPQDAFGIAVQGDDRIVIAGSVWNGTNYDVGVLRFESNGAFDTTFGAGGMVATPVGATNDYGYAVALQDDGKIIVAGGTVSSNRDVVVVRYNSDGTLDDSFGASGKVVTAAGCSNDFARSVVVQPDGKIVVAGYSHNGHDYDFAVLRYNPDGSPDPAFNADGKVVTNIGSGDDVGFGVALQPDGKIVVAGYAVVDGVNQFVVTRYQGSYTALESWRIEYFASAANSGEGADENDFDGDGLVNLLEFATRSDPRQAGALSCHLIRNGGTLEFTYPRAKAALGEVSFIVEWSGTLLPGSWSAVDVTQSFVSEDESVQIFKAMVPEGDTGRCFVRLRVVPN